MKIYVKFNFNALCEKILKEKLQELNLSHSIVAFGEVDFHQPLTKQEHALLVAHLEDNHIEIVENQKSILVQKLKDTIIDMVFNEDTQINVKSSAYLSDQLGHSYGFLANVFSEVTYSSIESYIILQKIEYSKQLILRGDLSLTEIAFKLNYSSVAHLSTQFKNVTGLTPSMFQRIIEKRKQIKEQ